MSPAKSIEITVPVLPESVADALLLEWKKQIGERVSRDEILVEVETDKIVLEVVAPEAGVITEILQQPGATVLSGDVLARVEPGAAPQIDAPAESAKSADSAEAAAPTKPAVGADDNAGGADSNAGGGPSDDDHLLSPAVRRLVEEHGLNPASIEGSGRDGRVTKEDILGFISDQVSPDAPAPKSAAAAVVAGGRTETREQMSRLRRTIANRLVQAQQTAALLTTFNEVNMQPVMDLRARSREAFEKAHGVRLGFMSFFVKAGVAALQKYPLVNAHIDGDDIVRHNYNDIGIAVSSKRGLVVPIVRNCETLSFADVETQIREFGRRARDGKIGLDDLTGGTFTITNGGVFGSLLSTPIVNPPQSAILGMHKIEERPVAENGQVVIRPMMYLALSYDHRIVDGQEAVGFLVAVKESLEDPAKMLLEL